MAVQIFQTEGNFSDKGNFSNYIRFVKQKTKTARVINKSMPEGIKLRVLISLEIKLPAKRTFRTVKNIHPIFGVKAKSQTPTKTRMPLPTPMISEILLPFLKPKYPPAKRKRP